MCAVNHNAIVPTLKARGPINCRKSACNRRIVDVDLRCAQRSDRKSRVLFLVFARETDGSSLIRVIYRLQWRLTFGGPRADHFFGYRSLPAANNWNIRSDDSRVFTLDLLARFSQPFFMVELDRRC